MALLELFGSVVEAQAAFALGPVRFRCAVCGRKHWSSVPREWSGCFEKILFPGRIWAAALPYRRVPLDPPFWLRRPEWREWRQAASVVRDLYRSSQVMLESPSGPHMLAVASSVRAAHWRVWLRDVRVRAAGELAERRRRLWRRYCRSLAVLRTLMVPREFPAVACDPAGPGPSRIVFTWPGAGPSRPKGGRFVRGPAEVVRDLFATLNYREGYDPFGCAFQERLAGLLASSEGGDERGGGGSEARFLYCVLKEIGTLGGVLRALVAVTAVVWPRGGELSGYVVRTRDVLFRWPAGAFAPSLGLAPDVAGSPDELVRCAASPTLRGRAGYENA